MTRYRFISLSIVMLVFLVASLTGCANTPTNIQASSDCSSVSISYTAQGGTAPTDIALDVLNAQGAIVGHGTLPGAPVGQHYTVTIPLNPPQPDGTVLLGQPSGGTQPITCHTGTVSFFNPGDNRVAPLPGDRIAAWCDLPDTITIWGIDGDSRGFPLAKFSYKAVRAAGNQGIHQTAGAYGTVSVSTDGKNNFWVAWTGPHADGQPGHGFAKGFSCTFGQ